MIGWRILCGGLGFVAVATIAAAGLSILAGRLEPRGAWIAMALGLSAGIAAARGASAPRQKITTADTILFVVFGLAALRAFLWVVYPEGPDLKILSPHNLGDIALHLNLILRWANGGTFWPENPFLAGAVFPYHPGMDFWNAILGVLGLPVIAGLRWTGLLGAAATAAALWRYGRGFALASFLFAGGVGALVLLREGVLDGQQDAAAWKNLFLTMLVTQRGMLFSLPAGFVLLTVWRTRLSGSDGPRLSVPAQAALYASMPFFNAPAFVFLSAVLAVSFFAGWRTGRSRDFLSVTLLAVIPATWLVRMVTGNFTAPNALRWAPGWMQGENGWWFWLENFGLFLPLAAVLGILLMRRGAADTATRVFYGVADPDFGPVDEDILDERDYTLAQLAPAAKRKFRYEYDFGDGWEHEVVVEKTLPPDPAFKYSVCLAGENACPPEDCGGIGGFCRLLEALADPEDPEHEEMQGWVEADWNPAAFDCARVNADLKRFKA